MPRGRFDIRDERALDAIVKQAFSRRRKTLRNALQGLADQEIIESIGLDPGLRPEQVSIEDWVALANTLEYAPKD